MHQISTIRKIRIFIAKFENATQCSHADATHFIGAYIDEKKRLIKNIQDNLQPFYHKLDERGLGWHFFSLGNDSIRAASIGSTFTPFQSDVPEIDRVSSIKISLSRGIKTGDKILQCSVKDLNDQRHYCQFSGGGDLFFNVSEEAAVMCTDAIPLDRIDGSPQHNDDILTGNKTEARSTDALKYQLMANMIIGSTKAFVDTLMKRLL